MQCSVCKKEITLARGVTFFKRDGSAVRFCSRKCERTLEMKRRSPTWITKGNKAKPAAKK